MIIRIFIAAIGITAATPAFAENDDGPFGLSWGMTKEQVAGMGIALEPSSATREVEVFKATRLPKNLSISEFYGLTFGKNHHLQKVEMLSKDIDGDIYGSEGKEIFENLKETLIKKYGPPTNSLESVGAKLWDGSDEFYQCLAYEGCGMWVAIFQDKKNGAGIMLELKGLGRGKGFIDLTYEGPKWSDVVDAVKARESATNEEAL